MKEKGTNWLTRWCRLLSFSAFLSICSVVLSQEKAFAWFEICNRSTQKAYTSLAYFDAFDNREGPRAAVGYASWWISEGWWTLNPGECTKVYPHELWRRNRYYYVYAEAAGRRFTWSGNKFFCVARGSAFTVRNADLPPNSSPRSSVPNGCYIEGGNGRAIIDRLGFIEVDIGSGRTQNFTFNLR